MEKYQKYADYKNIESIFLKAIPINWDIKPLYTVCDFRQGKAHEPFVDDDGEYIYVSARFVSTQGASFKQCSVNLTPAKLNDVLMVMSDLPNGRALARAFFVKEMKKYAVNQRVCAITAKIINPKFIYYQLDRSPYFLMNDDGSNQTHLSNNTFMKYPVLVPSEVEQKKIVDFLDYETAKIDSLIAKQEKLIELLQEKRQAVINHAVTKGLNPDVAMKDSGVEWLGQVPEHWTVSKLKYFASIQGGFAFSSDLFIEEGTQVLRIGNVYQNSLSLDRQPIFIASDLVKNFQDFIVKKDDVLMSLTGTLGKRDYGFAIKVETDDQYLLNQRVAKISPNKKIDTDFMVYVLWSESYLTQLYSLPSGTKQANLSNSDVLGIEIVIPPTMEEQKDIARYIKEKLAKFDEMILKAESAIQLMQERRTALISSAVTGKIDVRHWQNPTEARTEFSA